MIYQSYRSVLRFSKYENISYLENKADIGPALRYLGDKNNILKTQIEELSVNENNAGDIYPEVFQFDYK